MKSLWILVLLAVYVKIYDTSVRFTNIKCAAFHPDFATFQQCQLKVIARGVIGLNVHVKLWQLPVNNISVNLALFKKFSGYKPFLYNITVDLCKYLKNPRKHPFLDLFHRVIVNDSNINHTCPYNHDIIVKNVLLNENNFKYLPLPRGEYRFDLKVAAYNDWKADVKAFIDISNDL
ncbi:uncharacterized protein LOC109612856 isoform X1 [Musca domestica]|uniref:Uncharacterized protein LOC109612856 isoform X1 n=1 Tax=Musca domestica TaxID=7370 RepID=A0A9J7DIH4_MUSDO|nr:uncharacterized protein LOC109612856 isoform X1 [Musca domestica]